MALSKEYFTVTEDHLKLLRNAYVSWDACEFGAPAIDCKRPYGNSNVIGDIAEILDDVSQADIDRMDNDGTLDAWYDANEERLTKIHKETQTVLEIALRVGYFKPGRYVAERYKHDWRPAGPMDLEVGMLVRLGSGTVPYRVLEINQEREVALIVRVGEPDDEQFAASLNNLYWYTSE